MEHLKNLRLLLLQADIMEQLVFRPNGILKFHNCFVIRSYDVREPYQWLLSNTNPARWQGLLKKVYQAVQQDQYFGIFQDRI